MRDKIIFIFIVLGMLSMMIMAVRGSNSKSSPTYSISGVLSGAVSQDATIALSGVAFAIAKTAKDSRALLIN